MPDDTEPRYDPLRLENQLCFPMYAASRQVIRHYRPFLDGLGLTYTQYLVMLVLWEEPSVSVKALGQRLCLDSGTLTPVLKSLEAKGLLIRRRPPQDERVVLLSLTEKGRLLRERALSVPHRMAACVRLSPEETQQLRQLLYKLMDAQKEG